MKTSAIVGMLLILSLLLGSCRSTPSPLGFTAPVGQIVNGQQFEVAGIAGQPEITERVCLEGIRVPDLSQAPWGAAAKAYLEQTIARQSVRLEADAMTHDPTGCRLAYGWRGSNLLNEMLVAQGYAMVTPHPPNHRYDRRLAAAQDRARTLGLGIWNPANPLRQLPSSATEAQKLPT